MSTAAIVGLLAVTTIPSIAATPIRLDATLSQPLDNAEQFLARHLYTNVKEKGVRVQAASYTIRQLQDLQVSLREGNRQGQLMASN